MRKALWVLAPALVALAGLVNVAAADDTETSSCEESGVITRITDSEIFIRKADGDEDSFDLKDETTGLTGLAIGDRIHIQCREEMDDDIALAIRKLGTGETWTKTGCEETGTIVSITDSEIELRKGDGDVDSFDLKMDTTGITGLKIGDRVRVRCFEESDDDVALAIVKLDGPTTPATPPMTSSTTTRRTVTERSTESPAPVPPPETKYTSLPETAGPMPLAGLLSLASLGTWIVLRKRDKR